MQRLQRGLWVAVGAFSLTGCSFFGGSGDIAVIADVPVPAESEMPAADGTADGEVFADPGTEVPTAILTTATPDLIRSTNPDERARQVQRSRPDPFASLAIPPSPQAIVLPPGEEDVVARRPSLPERSGSSSSANSGGSQPSSPPSRTAASPPAKPPAPQATTARTVSVSGVVRIDGTTFAIVRVPNEPERYVRQGDRIANNRVLVKRIDVQSAEPKIVLEENGVEVAMGISEAAVASNDQTAADPSSQLPSPVSPSLAALPVLNSQ